VAITGIDASPNHPEMRDALQGLDVRVAFTAGISGALSLRRVTVMHAPRIELTGFDAEDVSNLKAKGLIGEIISWKLRLFLPIGEDGPRILGKLLHSHPVIGTPPNT
jgi:hypothetical protein